MQLLGAARSRARVQSFGERVGVRDLALRRAARRRSSSPCCSAARRASLLRRLERAPTPRRRALGSLHRRVAQRVGRGDRCLTRACSRRGRARRAARTARRDDAAGPGPPIAARQPDGAARVDERGAVVDGLHVAEQRAHPRACRRRRVDAMRQRIRSPSSPRCVFAERVERQEQQRARVRRRVPRANRVGGRAIAHEHRVHRRAEEPLDEQRRRLIGADEIGQRAEDRAVAELLALAKQSRGGRRESDALALERVERVDLALERRVSVSSARNSSARAAAFAFARLAIASRARLRARGRRARRALRAPRRRLAGALELARDASRAASASCARSASSCSSALRQLVAARDARARDRSRRAAARSCSSRVSALGVLERGARVARPSARVSSSSLLALRERLARRGEQLRPRTARARSRRCSRSVVTRAPYASPSRRSCFGALAARRARCADAPRRRPSRRGSAGRCSRCADTSRSSSVRCASAAARLPCAASRAASAARRASSAAGTLSRSSCDALVEPLRAPRATPPSRASRA